jgi:predicted kinase
VPTNAVGQVCATTRAKMRVVAREIGSKFMLPEAFGARATVRNRLAQLAGAFGS